MKNLVTFLLAATALSGVFAQAPAPQVGTVEAVKNLVTVTQNNAEGKAVMGTAISGTPVINGATVVTTSTGSAVVVLIINDRKCEIPMRENQSLTINTALSCKSLIAAIGNTGSAVALGPIPDNVLLATGAFGTAALITWNASGR